MKDETANLASPEAAAAEGASADASLRLVHVRWIDSKGVTNEWQELDALRGARPCECVSVGFLLAADDELLHIVPHLAGEPPAIGLGDMVIPAGAVIEVVDLAPVRSRRSGGRRFQLRRGEVEAVRLDTPAAVEAAAAGGPMPVFQPGDWLVSLADGIRLVVPDGAFCRLWRPVGQRGKGP